MFDIIQIFKSIKKNIRPFDVLLVVCLLILFFLTRLINLEKLPIFGDEGIYIRWAKTAWHDPSWRFISLTDGKQPLQTWMTIPFLKLFPTNALLAGRLFSTITGMMSVAGLFSLLFYLFNKKTAFWGSFLYIVTPYFLFYDRMALADSGVNAAFIWIFFFSILLIKTIRLDTALIFGLLSGFFLLMKSSVRVFLAMSLFAPLLALTKNWKKNAILLINFLALFLILAGLSFILYNVQRLSPFFHYVAEKNKTFVMTFGEWRQAPFSFLFHNLKIIPLYVFSEMGWLINIFALPGLWFLFKKNGRLALYILIWIFVPYLVIALFSKVIFPRYLIFFGSLILILVSYFFGQLKQPKNLLIPVFLILLFTLYFDYAVIFNPINLPFPEIDRGQYVKGTTAGWGVKEIVDFAREKAKEKTVILLAEGGFGVVGDQLEVFINQGDNVFVKGYWPLDEKSFMENQNELKDKYVYVVFSHRQEFPDNWPIKFIKRFPKPNSDLAIHLYQLTQ